MEKSIHEIIEQGLVTPLYQPIVSLITGEVMGYEALSRGPEWSRLFSPIALIEEAGRYGLTAELEYLFRRKAITSVKGLETNQKLFINVSPNMLQIESHPKGITKQMLQTHQINPSNVVFELTERTMIADYHAFNEILSHYRHQEYKIAIDDVGAGYSGLRTIRETKPNFIKIDMELIRNIDSDSFKEALINAFLNFSISTNVQLIAEGIETEGELLKLIEMGVHYGQGYFLQRPSKTITKVRQEVIELIQNHNCIKHDFNIFNDAKNMIGTITGKSCYLNSMVTCTEAKRIFEETNCEGMVIVRNHKPIGIIMRDNLLLVLSSQYGLSLYGKKAISNLMDTDFLMVDYHTTISEVSMKAMARDRSKIYDIIVVTKDSACYGTIAINALLQNLISVETQIAKELNPLTHLPGNIIINRVLNDLILYTPECGVIYVDIDDFKPYNDYYGFESGDQVIKSFAQIMLTEIKNILSYGSFIGHIGGDDFICVLEASREMVEDICRRIIRRFEEKKSEFYAKQDYANGYIEAKSRSGHIEQFDLITISISGIYNNLKRFDTVAALSKHMSDLKKESKAIKGNSIIIQ